MATGEIRGAFSMSEPGCGSDVSAIKTKAVRDGDSDDWSITGQKMWLTNGGSANLVAVLVKTDTGADSVYRNMSTFLIDKTSGFGETAQGVTIPGKIEKMGYKGVDTTELILDGHRTTTASTLHQHGESDVTLVAGVAYAQQRETFGKKIVEHQAVLFRLADMAVKVEAGHELMVKAARKKDSGERNDLEPLNHAIRTAVPTPSSAPPATTPWSAPLPPQRRAPAISPSAPVLPPVPSPWPVVLRCRCLPRRGHSGYQQWRSAASAPTMADLPSTPAPTCWR